MGIFSFIFFLFIFVLFLLFTTCGFILVDAIGDAKKNKENSWNQVHTTKKE